MSAAGPTDRVVLAHGGGGELMNRLLREHVVPVLGNPTLAPLTDGAVLPRPEGELVFTTDSYVVTPLEFPGGTIGRLAVAGTVNDLAVMGATPLALSLGLILEEGLSLARFDRILADIAATAAEAGVPVVTGDTKVIERRQRSGVGNDDVADGLFINTAGVGVRRLDARLGVDRVQPADTVLFSGRIAEHGLTILSVRNGIEFDTELRTDAAPLNHLVAALLDSGADVKFLRDATRGGVAGVLTDVSEGRNVGVEIEEERLPVSRTARHAAEMLGLDPLVTANEGVIVAVVAGADAERALAALRGDPRGRNAAVVGRIVESDPPMVELLTQAGGRRVVQRPYGEELPRIC